MSDNVRRFMTIKAALHKLYPKPLSGRQRQSMTVLAMFINGIVASGSTHQREVAKRTPTGAKTNSREKQLYRWYANENNEASIYFLPFIESLLAGLDERTYTIAIDGSEIGRGCLCLMATLIYQKRAIPLAWVVVQGNKGHFPATTHCELLAQVQARLPQDASVVVVGDGEFDSIALQKAIQAMNWEYVCRTASSSQIFYEGEWIALSALGVLRGNRIWLTDVLFSYQEFGPVSLMLWWDKAEKEPLYLVSNLELACEACSFYKKRMCIETFFSDQKSRGFHLHKSHVSDPARLARLLIAACLAYIWIIYLGVIAKQDNWVAIIHRPDRCDLSLFQLGLDLLEHFLNEILPIPVKFHLPLPISIS